MIKYNKTECISGINIWPQSLHRSKQLLYIIYIQLLCIQAVLQSHLKSIATHTKHTYSLIVIWLLIKNRKIIFGFKKCFWRIRKNSLQVEHIRNCMNFDYINLLLSPMAYGSLPYKARLLYSWNLTTHHKHIQYVWNNLLENTVYTLMSWDDL